MSLIVARGYIVALEAAYFLLLVIFTAGVIEAWRKARRRPSALEGRRIEATRAFQSGRSAGSANPSRIIEALRPYCGYGLVQSDPVRSHRRHVRLSGRELRQQRPALAGPNQDMYLK